MDCTADSGSMPSILFEDVHCLAVSKPPGMLSQGRPRDGMSLEGILRRYLDPDAPDSVYLAAIHRLDRPVSGVMIWGKTPKAARRLHQQFSSREVEKQYWAIVPGCPSPVEGIWDDWLCEEDTGLGPVVQVCHADAPRARHALTRYRVDPLGTVPEGCSRLRLWPRTGRTHQLRVQASSRGLPILGDAHYGSDRPFPVGIALHARSLAIRHPMLRTEMLLTAPLPDHWPAAGIILPDED
ncbi:RluA family pseudouridine synthase [Tautonia sociabilis]|uniref:RluA family pseudouridine synthase n=1 Tax=Tautonia sociabilis TaxID=2080755 RepID=A0A432MDG9_9BACT|nr:RluA family pseudouridine synthase [Tautonia sociabilis]RUL82518.1 RluA family pseudouridine synthase [Tautonia sociabilis]